MTKPDKIWAVFKEYRNPKDKVPEVYASASPTKGDEFLLSTPAREHAEELVEVIISLSDALEHALYQLPKDCNQILGMKGALGRAAVLLAKIKEQTDE